MPLTHAQRLELNRLEAEHRLWMLRLHQSRLMCSALRREIRLSKEGDPFRRLDKIVIFSDSLMNEVKGLRR